MMMNDVVKSSELSELFFDFNTLIHSAKVNDLCRKKKCDFTRNRNMNFYSIIYYFIFRNRTTTNSPTTLSQASTSMRSPTRQGSQKLSL